MTLNHDSSKSQIMPLTNNTKSANRANLAEQKVLFDVSIVIALLKYVFYTGNFHKSIAANWQGSDERRRLFVSLFSAHEFAHQLNAREIGKAQRVGWNWMCIIKYHVAGVVRVGVAHDVAVYVPGVTAQASSQIVSGKNIKAGEICSCVICPTAYQLQVSHYQIFEMFTYF